MHGVPSVAGQHRVFAHVVAQHDERREGETELQDARGGDEAGEVGHLRDRRRDDEREGPVQGRQECPDDFAGAGVEARGAQEGDEHVVVDDLEADVSVEERGDAARDELDGVDGRVPAVRGQALVGRVDGVLALAGVDEEAEDEVEGVDEGFGADEGLPKVKRPRHLRQEFDKEDRAAETVHGRHDAGHGDGEGQVGPDPRARGDGLVGRDAEGCVGFLGGRGEDA